MLSKEKTKIFIQPQAVVPVYHNPGGDCTALYYEKEVKTYPGSINHYLDRWAGYYFIDPAPMTGYFRDQGLTGPIPLYLGGQIYISIKTRKAKVPGDKCYGYFAYNKIKDLNSRGLILGTHEIPLACSPATAKKAIHNGILVEKIIQESPRFSYFRN